MSKIAKVIGWKFNHQAGMRTEDGVIVKFPGGVPSQDDIDIWVSEYDAYILANKYRSERKKDYPDYGDQLDMLYHDIMNDTLGDGEWVKTIKGVKEKYPKP